jgi:eukaryotic-like serine/threonine-protein kinase
MNTPMEPADTSEAAIFDAALACASPQERAASLEKACAGKPELRRRIEGLLAAHDQATGFLENPQAAAARPTVRLALKPEEQPGERIGRYKLLQKIGEGGCGAVYMAEQEEPVRRRVALKIIKLGMDTRQVVARFEAERQALALMDHPNIAKVLDAGATEKGRPFFVMELVKGISVTRYADENKLDTRQRLDLFIQICQAVQHAHQKGIIHRDIKPSNVLVADHDGTPVPKVIDFGIAKATTDQRLTDKTLFTALEQFIGTPAYMSPEQAKLSGLDVDTRSDIYSLGVLLYELLTGKTPFDARRLLDAGFDEIRRIIREEDPPRPSTRLSTLEAVEQTDVARHRHSELPKLLGVIRGDLDWIVMKCLEKDRSRRYETASGLARDIQRHVNNEPIVARPPSNLYRFQKMVRRNKLGFAAGAAIAASLIIGLSTSTWLFIKEKSAYNRAVAAEQQEFKLRSDEQKLRAQAQGEEAKAKTAAAKSEQVAEFMKAMLNGVGPSVALGRDTTMLREILDKTAERLTKDLKDQPEVEAELRSTLGGVYLELGDYQKAEGLLKEALELRRKLYGNEHPLVAESLSGIVTALLFQGKLGEAETLSRESLAICRKLGSNKDVATAQALHNLAVVLTRQMKLVEAEALHREALAMRKQLLGTENNAAAESLTELAFNQHMEGKLAESEGLYREAIAIQRKLAGNPALTIPLMALAIVVEQQGKLAEAEALYRECLAMQRKFLGNEHPHVAVTLKFLAGLMENQGKTAEAKTLREQATAISGKAPGNAEIARAQTQVEKGVGLLQQGKGAEAETQLREGLSAFRKYQGNDDSATLSILGPLAIALGQQKRWVEAEALNREALVIEQKLGNGEQTSGAQARFNLAQTLQQQGKLAEAEPLLREALTVFKKVLGSDHKAVTDTASVLAQVCQDQGKFAQAEPLLSQVLESHRRTLGEEHENTLMSMNALAWLYQSQGKYAQAEPLLTKAIETGQRVLGEENMATLISTKYLAYAYLAQGKTAQAEPLFAKGLEISRRMLGEENDQTLIFMQGLASVYRSQGKLGQAEPILTQTLELRRRVWGEDNPGTMETVKSLGEVCLALGKDERAEPLLIKTLEFQRRQHGNDDDTVVASTAALAHLSLKLGKFSEAEPLLHECLTYRTQHLPDDWRRFNSETMLGGALLGQKRLAEAEPLLRSGYEGMKAREAKIPAYGKSEFKNALERLVQLYEAKGDATQTTEWKQKLAEFIKAEGEKRSAVPQQ